MNALIIVDVQNDFLPEGALAVPEGDSVVPVINQILDKFELIVATQDWHPSNHGSFASQHPHKQPGDTVDLFGVKQILWPDHCIQDTSGAAFADELDFERIHQIFPKGMNPQIDSYSGFFDNGHRHATGLADYLKHQQVKSVFICGLATDYCVRFTAIDAVKLGFTVTLVEDACRGVNIQPNDVTDALAELTSHGVRICQSNEIPMADGNR